MKTDQITTSTTTVDDLSGADLLRWLVRENIPLSTAAAFTGVGFTNLNDIVAGHALGAAFLREVDLLSHRGIRPPAQVTIDKILTVGHLVLSGDLPNIDAWSAVGESVRGVRFTNDPYGKSQPWEVCNAFMAAGRSPSFAAEMVAAAIDTGRHPMTYGLDREITTSIFRSLVEAGVRTIDELESFRSNGLDLVSAIQLAAAGVRPEAVNAAVAAKLPDSEWLGTLAGLPADWFVSIEAFGRSLNPDSRTINIPDPLGMMSLPGATWEKLHELAHNGWATAPMRLFESRSWKSDAIHFISIDDALIAARAGIAFEELEKWFAALTLGKSGHYDWRSQTLPPIAWAYHGSVRVEMIIGLRELGVRPAWIPEYRSCGARTIEDLFTIAELGVTKKKAAELREAHGQPISPNSTRPSIKRFPTLSNFVDAVSSTPTQKA